MQSTAQAKSRRCFASTARCGSKPQEVQWVKCKVRKLKGRVSQVCPFCELKGPRPKNTVHDPIQPSRTVPFCSYPAPRQIQTLLLIIEFWRGWEGLVIRCLPTWRGRLRKDQDPSKNAVSVDSQPLFPMMLRTFDAQVTLAESHAQKAMEARAASEVSAACLILCLQEMNMGMNWCNGQTLGFFSNNSGCLETVLSSLVRAGCRAKIEQFAKAQTTENFMMTTTNALTAVQENAGSSGCCFLNQVASVLILSTARLVTFMIRRICDVSCPEQSGCIWASMCLTEINAKLNFNAFLRMCWKHIHSCKTLTVIDPIQPHTKKCDDVVIWL